MKKNKIVKTEYEWSQRPYKGKIEIEAGVESDQVNHPSHYTDGQYEVIDILQDKMTSEEFKGFLKGNVLKYTLRAGKKSDNTKQDLEKAEWYLNRLIQNV